MKCKITLVLDDSEFTFDGEINDDESAAIKIANGLKELALDSGFYRTLEIINAELIREEITNPNV
jgi:hypothetical protein